MLSAFVLLFMLSAFFVLLSMVRWFARFVWLVLIKTSIVLCDLLALVLFAIFVFSSFEFCVSWLTWLVMVFSGGEMLTMLLGEGVVVVVELNTEGIRVVLMLGLNFLSYAVLSFVLFEFSVLFVLLLLLLLLVLAT
jgi:hypothetical protein